MHIQGPNIPLKCERTDIHVVAKLVFLLLLISFEV